MSSSKDSKDRKSRWRSKLKFGSKSDKTNSSLTAPSSTSVDIVVKNSQAQISENAPPEPNFQRPTTDHDSESKKADNGNSSSLKHEAIHGENALPLPSLLEPVISPAKDDLSSKVEATAPDPPAKSSFFKRFKSPPSAPRKSQGLKPGSDLDSKSDKADADSQSRLGTPDVGNEPENAPVVSCSTDHLKKIQDPAVTNPFELANPMAAYRSKLRERDSWETPSSTSGVLQYPNKSIVSSSLNGGSARNSTENFPIADENIVQEIPESERGEPIRPPRLLPYNNKMETSDQMTLFCVKLRTKQTISEDLWSRAYQRLEENEPKQIARYKQIWNEMYAGSPVVTGENQTAQKKGVEEMLEAIKTAHAGREKLKSEDKLKGYADGFSKVMSVAGELIKDAMKVTTGSGPLGPISVLLKAMDNNIEETNANRQGLDYVIQQIRWYTALAKLILKEDKGDTAELRYELDLTVLEFYSEMLLFLIKSINSYNRNRFSDNVRQAFKFDDWEGSVQNIKEAKESVQERLNQYQSQFDREKERLKAIGNILKEELQPYISTGQRFDANELSHIEFCQEGTRTNFLRMIKNWAMGAGSKPIFWLGGTAGTGKSTIAKTVAKQLAELGYLGASFFFQTGVGDRTKAKRVIPSFAAQMANPKYGIPGVRELITQAIEEDPESLNTTWQDQWKHLIQEPLSQLAESYTDDSPRIVVFIIDALDECDSEGDVEELLDVLLQAQPDSEAIQCRFFLTSRPEYVIRVKFDQMETEAHHDAVLHDLFPDETRHDISLFLTTKLTAIEEKRSREEFPSGWVTEESVNKLTDRCGGLFIYAATVVRFLDLVGNPVEKLAKLLQEDAYEEIREGIPNSRAFEANKKNQDYKKSATAELDRLYQTILQDKLVSVANEIEQIKADSGSKLESMQSEDREASDISEGSESSLDWDDLLHAFRVVVGSVVLLFNPLTIDGLATLLGKPQAYVYTAIRSLGSVLSISQDGRKLVRLHHLSFRDFLLDEKRCTDTRLRIDAKALNVKMAQGALGLLMHKENGVKRDICSLRLPGAVVEDIDPTVIQKNVPPGLQYACRFWFEHCQLVVRASRISILRKVHSFVQNQSLYWIETLSILREIPAAVMILRGLQDLLLDNQQAPIDLLPLVEDLLRFLLCNKQSIEHAPLQIYASALLFAPRESRVRKLYEGELPAWVSINDVVPDNWDSRLQALQRKGMDFVSVSLSKTSRWIAAGSESGTMVIWAFRTGDLRHELKVGARLDMLAFSPHAENWIVTVGKPAGYTGYSSITPGTRIRLWDVETGTCSSKFSLDVGIGKFGVTFSPSDPSVLAVWSDATGAQLYLLRLNASHFELSHTLTNYLHLREISNWEIRGISFHPQNSTWLVSVCQYRIRGIDQSPEYHRNPKPPPDRLSVWSTETGVCLSTSDLEHSTNLNMNQLLFSPLDPSLFAVIRNSEVVDFWTLDENSVLNRTHLEISSQSGSSPTEKATIVSAAFSPFQHNRFATGYNDGSVRIWDFDTGACQAILNPRLPSPKKGRGGVIFPPDPNLFISLEKDMVNIWDLQAHLDGIEWEFISARNGDVLDFPCSKLSVTQSSSSIYGSVKNLDFRYSPDLKRLLSKHKKQTMHREYGAQWHQFWMLWDTDGTRLAILEHPCDEEDESGSSTSSVIDICFSHDSRFIVSLVRLSRKGPEWHVNIWDARTGVSLRRDGDPYPTYVDSPWLLINRNILFSPDSERFTVLSDLSSRRKLGPHADPREWDKVTKLQDFNHYLPIVVWSLESDTALELGWSSSDHVPDISGRQIGKFITRACFSTSNPKLLAASSRDPETGKYVVILWDVSENAASKKREPLMLVGFEASEFTGISLSSQGQLATVSLDRVAKIWDLKSGIQEAQLDIQPRLSELDHVEQQRKGKRNTEPERLDPHALSLAFSHGSQQIFFFHKSAGAQKFDCISIWDIKSGNHQYFTNGIGLIESLHLEYTSLRAPGLGKNVINENGWISTPYGSIGFQPVTPTKDEPTETSSNRTDPSQEEIPIDKTLEAPALELVWHGLGLSQDCESVTWNGQRLLDIPLSYRVPSASLQSGGGRFGVTDEAVLTHTESGLFCKYKFDRAELHKLPLATGRPLHHLAAS